MYTIKPKIFFILTLILLFSNACKLIQKQNKNEENGIGDADKRINEYNPTPTKYFDLIHTHLELTPNWTKKQLNGLAVLTLIPYINGQGVLVLDAKGFDINDILVLDNGSKKEVRYDYDSKVLKLYLEKFYNITDTVKVEINYVAKPESLPDIFNNEAVDDTKGLYFITPDEINPYKPYQLWTQGETDNNSCWFPTMDIPSEKCTQDIYITVEKKYKTISNGTLVSSEFHQNETRTDHWYLSKTHSPYLASIVIGQFEKITNEWNGKEVSYYVEPQLKKNALPVFGKTPEMMEYFSKKLNFNYPWDKYSQVVVRDFVTGGMENTSATTFYEEVLKDSRSLLDESEEPLIAHELFHQWFGDLVTCESWGNLALNEAFATYSEYLWIEEKYGKAEADFYFKEQLDEYLAESKEKKEPIIRYSYAEQKDLFDAHSYNKGAWVLHMLRKLLGDDIFWKALNIYLTKNQFQNTEIHHLRFAFEEASGQDLNWFFDQWFLAPGHPELKIKYIYDIKKGLVQITILQTQDTRKYPVFRLPAKLSIWDNNERTDYSIEINDVESSFTYKTSAQPNLVLFDSDFTLLAEIDYPKISSELVYQYNQNQDNAIVKLEAVTQMINLRATDVIPTLQKAIQDSFWGIREQAIKRFDRYDADQNVVALIKEKATKDPKAFVRAAAIDVISSFTSIQMDELRKIYIQAMTDSSYSVVGAALYDYLSTQPEDADKIAQGFSDYLQPTILNTIADYYTLKGDPKKYAWFEDKIRNTSGFTQFDLLGFFGDYLGNDNNLYENREKGAKLLNTIALHGKPYYVRFSAYKSLQLLEKKVAGVTDMLKQIKSIETNKKLFQMYDGME